MQKKIITYLFNKLNRENYRVTFWDGEKITRGSAPYKVEIIFKAPLPTGKAIIQPVLTCGEAYMNGNLLIKGNLEEVMRLLNVAGNELIGGEVGKKLIAFLNTCKKKITGYQQKKEVQHHYDIGNEFFSLWLDETMNYSCAYFTSFADTLYQAQLQKVDHVLKKLRLKPGEKLLDIGSGWGGLIIKAAQEYDVKALGITLSEEQHKKTKERIKNLGLEEQVDVKLMDYQNLSEERYQFDKIVSVGMFEHVGKENYPLYMKKVNKLLKPGGLSVLHTITCLTEGPTNPWIKKYIFPGGYIPSVRQIVDLLPEYDFNLLHAENLRRHYALTLERWHRNFCQQIDKVEKMFDQRFVRMWNLFLRGCAANFRIGGLNLHQFLFSKGVNNQLPLTKEYIHEE